MLSKIIKIMLKLAYIRHSHLFSLYLHLLYLLFRLLPGLTMSVALTSVRSFHFFNRKPCAMTFGLPCPNIGLCEESAARCRLPTESNRAARSALFPPAKTDIRSLLSAFSPLPVSGRADLITDICDKKMKKACCTPLS